MVLCRRICVATQGWTSSATSIEAQVRRVLCTGTTGSPALRALAWKYRWKFRGSTGIPYRVVTTMPVSCQAAPASAAQLP
jgi:hypothetical protein